ncbi:MAG TPA: tRNA (N6-threonylcarbamoyladenosine(37)-N6)-methyltransferase TrmO [Maritimibacter sp.]|nr:tRNA (N6-threonylcarbamoyladenosine(37)-N6)-methyltransferase TrmO [Maritimibacter sp.]
MTGSPDIREGEVTVGFDPAQTPDASVHFIGKVQSPWSPGDCPKNLRQAREDGRGAVLVLKPAFAPALAGLEVGQAIIVAYWMHAARRDMVVQAPRHLDEPRGSFAIRSPNRPNPVSLGTVTITAIDLDAGRVEIDAIDCFDGTPLVDIKPWLPTIDTPA